MMTLLCAVASLSGSASAQEAPTASGSVFDDSLSPVLENLLDVVKTMEDNNIQITDMVVAVVGDDGVGVNVPVTLPADADVILVAVGDSRRIQDLDMGVKGRDGLSGADQMDDNVPRVDVHTTYSGEYTANVVISQPVEGADRGYFFFLTGFPRDAIVASAQPVLSTLQLVVQFAEGENLRFVHGDLETIVTDKTAMIEAPIPQGTFSQCLAFAISSPDRTKKASLEVMDPSGNTLGIGKKMLMPQLVGTGFVNSEENERHFLKIGAKMSKGYGDSLAMGLVACEPMSQ
jgi:hypothetical protein